MRWHASPGRGSRLNGFTKRWQKFAFDRLAVLMCEIPQVDWYIMFSSLTHQGGMGRRPMQVVKPSQTFPIISMRDLHICSGAFAQEAKKHRHVKCVVRSTTGRWTWLLDTVGYACFTLYVSRNRCGYSSPRDAALHCKDSDHDTCL